MNPQFFRDLEVRRTLGWHTDTYELRETIWLAVWSQATELPTGLLFDH